MLGLRMSVRCSGGRWPKISSVDSEPLSDPVDPEGFFSNSRSETATPDPAQVLTRSGFMLRLVKQGLRDLEIDATDLSTDPNALDRILLGFVAVVVFGRAVTNALQNLRSFDRQAFDAWYEPWRREMQNDALLRWFYVLRSEILKRS